ncbi:MAG TPA: SusC/RagA family TonB-linked outer membrane protein, partial [Chitinophagaceae bacterium]|nr:SusC/RagA family TonB-linked outer membrane protein [Chitinophagaceae bacterium]
MKVFVSPSGQKKAKRIRHAFGFITFLFLIALFLPVISSAQATIRVQGRVTTESDQPVARASITVKGTNAGTVSDDVGNFEIVAASNGILIISSVDYAAREVKINGQTNLGNIRLVSLEKTMGEVVVTGYGTQRKKDVTGSIVTVTGATLREVAAPNLIAQLKGRVAGVDIVSNSSTPGGGGQIRIRGNRSLATTQGQSDGLDQPLVILDGMPFSGSINDINPEDISNLEILKDASATAIYGSRGSGGVILVSTKRGRNGKAVLSYDAYYGVSKIAGFLRTFTGEEFAQFKLDAAQGVPPPNTGSTAYGMTPAEQAALAAGVSTDWQRLILRDGFTTSHQISVMGGNNTTQFSMGGGYYKEQGIVPKQRFERITLRLTLDHQVSRRLKVGINTINVMSYSNTPGGSGVLGGLVRLTPLASPYNPDGSVNLLPQVGSTDAAQVSPLTLLTKSDAILARNRRIRTFNSLYGEFNILTGLKYRLNIGLDYRNDQGAGYNGPLTWTNTATTFAQANANVNNAEAYTWTIENILTYDLVVQQKHRFNFTGLFSSQKDHNTISSFNGLGFPADYVQNSNLTLANSVTAVPGQNTFSERGLVSYMGRLNYAYDNRYLLTATIRRDGASVLSPGNQYFTYPAINVGWNVSNEAFMNSVPAISNLKFRGGWGKTSNQGIAPYTTLGLLSTSAYNFGQTTAGQQAAYLVTTLANNKLKWEYTAQINVGMDIGLLKNRITASVDWYRQRTKDILLNVLLPPSNGAGSTTLNLGQTEGRGLEIAVNSINVQTKTGFTWSTDLIYYFNREKITQLTTPAEKSNIANGWFVGQPLTVIYDLKKIGIWQTKDAALMATQTTPVQFAGQIRIEDLNGDHKIDAADRQILGNFQPRWEGGMTNRFAFKNVELTVVMYARMGMKVLVPYVTADGGAQGFPFFMQSRNNQVKVDYWTPTNPTDAF